MKTQYVCEVCRSAYDTPAEALACEASTISPTLEVGDIVLANTSFGWFDGEARWVENFAILGAGQPRHLPGRNKSHDRRNCFGSCCNYRFYYVVTFIQYDMPHYQHQPIYHLATLAMTDETGYRGGWTTIDHVHPVKVVKVPSFIRKSSKSLLGKKYVGLL